MSPIYAGVIVLERKADRQTTSAIVRSVSPSESLVTTSLHWSVRGTTSTDVLYTSSYPPDRGKEVGYIHTTVIHFGLSVESIESSDTIKSIDMQTRLTQLVEFYCWCRLCFPLAAGYRLNRPFLPLRPVSSILDFAKRRRSGVSGPVSPLSSCMSLAVSVSSMHSILRVRAWDRWVWWEQATYRSRPPLRQRSWLDHLG